MHQNISIGRSFLLLAVLGMFLALAGCAAAPPPNVKTVQCTASKIEWEVAKEAEITEFGCKMGKKGMDPALIYTVGLKNVSERPLRFRLNIFLLDLDKAAGHLVPRKGKPPLVAPGDSAKVKIPFIKTTTMPRKIHVLVAPMRED